MNKLIVIIGPTASKKTKIAHEIAKIINGAIINGDAFQIYKEINAGVNKPKISQRKEINYYLLDILNVDQKYSIKDYQNDFDEAYRKIVEDKKIPILCGGSHLYVDSIVKGYDLSDNLTNELNELKKWNMTELNEFVKNSDYESYIKFRNNYNRLLRCAAYLKKNKKCKKEIEKESNKPKYNCLIIMVNKERLKLYEDINKRLEGYFLTNEWFDEINLLIKKYGVDLVNFQAMKAIGYLQVYESIIHNIEVDKETIKKKTRHLAKHQLTWCNNKFNEKIVFNYGKDNIKELIVKIENFLYD